MRLPSARGVTVVDAVVAVFAAIVLAVVVLMILLPGLGRTDQGGGARQFKDSSQIRGVLEGMVLWANSNQDRYPLPSRLDTANATVPELAEAKDTTANIMSILIFNSFFPPELLVNPAEADANIVRMENYSLDAPAAAVDPAHAL